VVLGTNCEGFDGGGEALLSLGGGGGPRKRRYTGFPSVAAAHKSMAN
jgi:hypothetical protein